MRISILTALTAAATFAIGSSAALADTTLSANWAGYAAHRSGVKFKKVVADWRAPTAYCTPGSASYSSVWVGLGGYSKTSTALEQVGTETDCSSSGTVISSAWYELVPAPSQPLRLTVRPGDLIAASVSVTGHTVSVGLDDVTAHRSFTKTLHASTVDVSSAEWIVEAPSDCFSDNSCQTLPLANFGTTSFQFAAAQTATGHTGAISNSAWNSTRIILTPGGRQFVASPGSGGSGAAVPSGLTLKGTSFTVNYDIATSVDSRRASSASVAVAPAYVPVGRLVHGVR